MEGRLKIFSGSSHRRLAEDICYYLDVPLGRSRHVQFFNQNMMMRQIAENVRECDVFVIQTSCPPGKRGLWSSSS